MFDKDNHANRYLRMKYGAGASLSMLEEHNDEKLANDNLMSSLIEQSIIVMDRDTIPTLTPVRHGPYSNVYMPGLSSRRLDASQSSLQANDSQWTLRGPRSYLEGTDFKRKLKTKRDKSDIGKGTIKNVIKIQDIDYFRHHGIKDSVIGSRQSKKQLSRDIEHNISAIKIPLLQSHLSLPKIKNHNKFSVMIKEASSLIDKNSYTADIIHRQPYYELVKCVKQEFDCKRIYFAAKNTSTVFDIRQSQGAIRPQLSTSTIADKPRTLDTIDLSVAGELQNIRYIRLANFQRNVIYVLHQQIRMDELIDRAKESKVSFDIDKIVDDNLKEQKSALVRF